MVTSQLNLLRGLDGHTPTCAPLRCARSTSTQPRRARSCCAWSRAIAKPPRLRRCRAWPAAGGCRCPPARARTSGGPCCPRRTRRSRAPGGWRWRGWQRGIDVVCAFAYVVCGFEMRERRARRERSVTRSRFRTRRAARRVASRAGAGRLAVFSVASALKYSSRLGVTTLNQKESPYVIATPGDSGSRRIIVARAKHPDAIGSKGPHARPRVRVVVKAGMRHRFEICERDS